MKKTNFGKTTNGQTASLYSLENDHIKIAISDYGASLVELWVRDSQNRFTDIILGYEDVTGYEQDQGYYIGCNVGRCANRIHNAEFSLNGATYPLDKNQGENTLHSGFHPYSKRFWTVDEADDTKIRFSLLSPDKDQGFPGNLHLTITYLLVDNTLKILYDGLSDADTILNMTHHSYFNLNGHGNGNILNHKVQICADTFVPIHANLIPDGSVRDVDHTPMDFRQFKILGKEIDTDYDQLNYAKGYDQTWCINEYDASLKEAVVVYSEDSGITMSISTDYPGIQMYTANFLNKTLGKDGKHYDIREGVCFEPQFYPDAIHHAAYPQPILKAQQPFHKEILYHFDH